MLGIQGIESDKCNFAHIDAEYSSNLSISKNYFHDAHNYGSGGKAYGVILHFTSNECKIEDNIFNHLRHSMIVQAGANGNVFSTYNYSIDPFWTGVFSLQILLVKLFFMASGLMLIYLGERR